MADGRLYLITPPAAEVLAADEARTLLGLSEDTPSDDLLEAMIAAVTGTLDAGTGWLGRALALQTWEYRLDAFPTAHGGAIVLPYPVLAALTSVVYDDSNGDEQTLVEDTDYRVIGLGGHNRARVEPIYNGSWPTARGDGEAVRIRYVAGYASDQMPAAIKAAVALGTRQLQSMSERNLFLSREETVGVRTRQWIVSDSAGAAIRSTIAGLLATYQVRETL